MKSSIVFVCCFALAQTGTMYCQKRVSLALGKYPYVMSIAQPVSTSICFGSIFAIKLLKSCNCRLGPDASVNAFLPFVLVGTFLSLANVLMFLGLRDDFVAGPLAVLLQQSVVVFSMVFSFVLLGQRYSKQHLLGAFIVIAGIACKSVIALSDDPAGSQTWAVVLVALATAPLSLGHILVEHLLKTLKQDIWWMWFWVNVLEVPFACLAAPLQLWLLHDISEWRVRISQGIACLLDLDDCPGEHALFLWCVFVSCLVMNRMFAALVIWSGSATFLFLGATVAIPLATGLYELVPFPSDDSSHNSFGFFDLFALMLVVVGLMAFHLAPKPTPFDGESVEWQQLPAMSHSGSTLS